MRLKDWIDSERGRSKLLAEHFAVTPSAVSQWLTNGVPPDRMMAMRDFTDGAVTLEEMLDRATPPAESAAA